MKESQSYPIQIIEDGFTCVLDTGKLAREITLDELLAYLADRGIVYGIDKEALKMVFSESEPIREKIVIARGVKPSRGLNARTILCYRPVDAFDSQAGHRQIDFRKTVKLAKKDEVLLVKLRATTGQAGKNVYGDSVQPEPGTDIEFIAGKNILKRYYEDKIEFSAFREGIVRKGKNNIQIESLHLIDHDINLNSGNLTLDSSVYINGSVMPTFKVSAGGSVTVSGQVEKAEITAKRDVQVYNLVTGGSRIISGGDIRVRLVEHSSAHATGDIHIEEDLIFAEITSGGGVVVGEGQGNVSGGVIRAANSIEVGSVGTPLGRQPELILGMDQSLTELETNVKKKEERIEQLQKMMKQMRKEGLSHNDWAARHLHKRLETLNAERTDLLTCIARVSENRKLDTQNNKIIVNRLIKRGSTVRIGSQSHIVMNDLHGGVFRIDPETGKIVVSRIKGKTPEERS